MKRSRIFLFNLGPRRIAIVIAVCCLATAACGWWLLFGRPIPDDPAASPVSIPPLTGSGTVDRALELHRAGQSLDALAELLSVPHPEEIVENPEAAAATVELLAAVGLEEDADRLTRMVVESTMRDLDAHIAGLADIAWRLYEINDLHRSLAVEEKLRILITELSELDPGDHLLLAFQVRLWAGCVTGFAQWDMVAWLTRGMIDLLEADDVFPAELRAELYGHHAQALMERWEGRDPVQARLAIDRALKLTERNGWLYYLSALLRQQAGDPRAGDDFARALELLPDSEEIVTAAALASVERVSARLDLLIELDGMHHDLSSDGRYVAAVDRGCLTIYDTAARNRRTTEQHPVREIGHVAWSPDGDRIAMLRSESLPGDGGKFVELAVISVRTEESETIIPAGRFSQLEGIVWAPDGGRLAVWGEPADGSDAGLYMVDLTTGEATLAFAKTMLWCEEEADWAWSPDGLTLAVLGASTGYPGTNARVWLVNDGECAAVDCKTSTEWHPGIVTWSVGGILTHWARDSWSVTPTKVLIIEPDGQRRIVTGGRSMESMPAWSSTGRELTYFTRPSGAEDWLLVFTDRERTWEATFPGNWRWWRSPIWSGNTVTAGIGPNSIGVFRLSGLPGH